MVVAEDKAAEVEPYVGIDMASASDKVTISLKSVVSKVLIAMHASAVATGLDPVPGFKMMKVDEKRTALEQAFSAWGNYQDWYNTLGAPVGVEASVPGTEVEKVPDSVVNQEVSGPDVLQTTAHDIENIKDAKTAEAMVREFMEDTEFTYFKLGGVLCVIDTKEWFGAQGNFRDYVEVTLGIGYRKARYLMSIYTALLDADIPWDKIKDLGWTKTMVLIEILTQENVDEWIAKAKTMTVLQLQEEVKAAKKALAGTSGEPEEASSVSTKTFKLHKDQRETLDAALDKAKGASGTEHDPVALEYICLEYIAPSKKKSPAKSGDKADAMEASILAHWATEEGHPNMKAIFAAVKEAHKDGDKYDLNAALQDIFSGFEVVWNDVLVTVVPPKDKK